MKLGKLSIFQAKDGYWPYLLLLNMVFPIFWMTLESPEKMIAGFGLLLLFLISYVLWFRRDRFTVMMIIVQYGVVFTLSFLFHPLYCYLLFISSYLVSRFNSMRNTIIFSVVGTVGMIGLFYYNRTLGNIFVHPLILLSPLFGVSVLPFIIRSSARYKEMAERLQAATKQMERMAQQEERQRIARELHDTLGHTLSLIALKSEVAEKMVERDPKRSASEAREIRDTARSALKQMRELVTNMRGVKLHDELEQAKAICQAAGISFHAIYNGQLGLTALQESILSMCLREGITNVVRHSQAKACTVELSEGDSHVELNITDDGIGFSSGKQAPDLFGNGLTGMRERLSLVDGQVQASSEKGKGTTLALRIPIVIRNLEEGEKNDSNRTW